MLGPLVAVPGRLDHDDALRRQELNLGVIRKGELEGTQTPRRRRLGLVHLLLDDDDVAGIGELNEALERQHVLTSTGDAGSAAETSRGVASGAMPTPPTRPLGPVLSLAQRMPRTAAPWVWELTHGSFTSPGTTVVGGRRSSS